MTPHTNLGSLYPEQRERLRAFRRAVEDLYRSLGADIGAGLRAGTGEERKLFRESRLIGGAMALRLTLLDGEQANFRRVLEVLSHLKDPAIEERIREIDAAWKKVEEGSIFFEGPGTGQINAQKVRDAWLYGRLSHHRQEWAQVLRTLEEFGDLAVFALQASILGHARLMIALDRLIAEVLGEPLVFDRVQPGDDGFFRRKS